MVAEPGTRFDYSNTASYLLSAAQDAVVVFTSDLPENQFFVPRDLVDEMIIPATESADSLPANPRGMARLDQALTAMREK